jgi:hypothetical protein
VIDNSTRLSIFGFHLAVVTVMYKYSKVVFIVYIPEQKATTVKDIEGCRLTP